MHGNGIPKWERESHGNGNKTQNWEWETTSLGMGITCTPMGIYSQRFYAAMSLLSYSTRPILARCQCLLCRVCRLPKCNLFCPACKRYVNLSNLHLCFCELRTSLNWIETGFSRFWLMSRYECDLGNKTKSNGHR